MLTACEDFDQCLKDLFTPLWWPGLSERFVSELGGRSEQYSTSQWCASVDPERIWSLPRKGTVEFNLSVEMLAPIAHQRFLANGGIFADEKVIDERCLDGLLNAITVLQQVPSLAAVVSFLVKSVHILEAPSPGFDVSFSDPLIPFSVFLNVSEGRFAALRTAESLVHEAMHLQLTLIEQLVPIAKADQGLHYSPWKRSMRPVSGLLHALYVFRVIDQWLTYLPKDSADAKAYARKRRLEIHEEMEQLAHESFPEHLTVAGRQLLSRLLMHEQRYAAD